MQSQTSAHCGKDRNVILSQINFNGDNHNGVSKVWEYLVCVIAEKYFRMRLYRRLSGNIIPGLQPCVA
jgi:hypothetical protein